MDREGDARESGLLDAVARVAVDRQGCVTSVDRVAADLYDVVVSDAVGRSMADVAGDQWFGPGGPDVGWAAIDSAGTWTGHPVHRTRAGLLPVAVNAHRLAGPGAVASGVLLTVRVDAERIPVGNVGVVRSDIAVVMGTPRFPAILSLVGWLLTARSAEEIGAAVCGTLVETLDAVGGHFAVLGTDGTASFTSVVGYSAATRDAWTSIDLELDTPVRTALLEGVAVYLADRAERHAWYPLLVAIRESTEALCAVPVALGGRVAGSFGLSFRDARVFGPDDRALLATVAHIAALALQHTGTDARQPPMGARPSAPSSAVEFTWTGDIDLAAVRTAIRTHTRSAGRDVEDVLLCASELLTNAVEHAGGPIHFRMETGSDALRIEVSDTSRRLPQMRDAGPGGGFGLRIVERVADRWGTEPAAWGKTTWAELAR